MDSGFCEHAQPGEPSGSPTGKIGGVIRWLDDDSISVELAQTVLSRLPFYLYRRGQLTQPKSVEPADREPRFAMSQHAASTTNLMPLA